MNFDLFIHWVDSLSFSRFAMERFCVESCVRGYIYKDIWEASVGEELPCQRESGNRAYPFAVAVVRSGITVGHIPRKISSVCSFFLRKGGVINICTVFSRLCSACVIRGWKILWVENFMTRGIVTKITKISTPRKLPAIR